MEFIFEIGLFVSKAFIILVTFVGMVGFIFVMAAKSQGSKGQLQVEAVNKKLKNLKGLLKSQLLDKKDLKALSKESKKADKLSKKDKAKKPRLFVLEFEGDIKASDVENLRQEITSLLTVAEPGDEVLCLIESQGGMVHTYGLAASQLQRVKDKGLKLTASIDKVAASGGYLMACVANEIIAAPFAIVGSIGVVAQVPNVHRLLKKHDVDYQEYTAGEFKRTVSLLGQITPEGEKKFVDQLQETHKLFKSFVSQNRPQLDINSVATGEYWYGTQAKDLGLIDQLITSDSYLMQATESRGVYKLSYSSKKGLSEKLSEALQAAGLGIVQKLWGDLEARRWGL